MVQEMDMEMVDMVTEGLAGAVGIEVVVVMEGVAAAAEVVGLGVEEDMEGGDHFLAKKFIPKYRQWANILTTKCQNMSGNSSHCDGYVRANHAAKRTLAATSNLVKS